MERPGELVTREELRRRLWPADTFVDFEHGLNAAVKRLRDTLGDSADTPRFVETVPRRGYRFIGAIDGTVPPTARAPIPRGDRLRRLAVFSSAAAILAVAALGYVVKRARPASPPPDRALTRLTFAPGLQTEPTWSPDGRESFAFQPDVTRDGDRLAFMVDRSGGKGGFEIRTRSLVDDQETLVVSWGPLTESREGRIGPGWSPDGTRLAYAYWNSSVGEGTRVMVADAGTGSEQPITSFVPTAFPFDWSNDGKWLLASLKRRAADPVGVWTVPLPAAPDAEKDARLIASDAHYELWQPRFSRDNRWVVFNAVAQPDQSWSTLYVVPASGGSWTQITEGSYWDDKPRWSPDGKSIYFISSREGLFNVWVVAFDPERGLVEGHPVRVTAFTGPGRQLLHNVIIGDIAVSGDRLFVCLEEASGSIWTLDKVDR